MELFWDVARMEELSEAHGAIFVIVDLQIEISFSSCAFLQDGSYILAQPLHRRSR